MFATSWPELLTRLVRRTDLSADETAWAMQQILSGEATSAQVAGFLVALRSKGETIDELTGLSQTMLSFATPIALTGEAVDIVGSGGDRAHTVNVSTMAAIAAAASGARVVKHGNRAASSASGAADVLEALGVVLDLTPGQQAQVIDQVGIGFLFAAHYHPAFRHAAAARAELGISTTFNFLGPLTNPGGPRAHAVGVADPRMVELVAGVFAGRGDRGLVFHGGDGLDELTTTTTSRVWLMADGEISEATLDPADLGIPRATVAALVGGSPAHNAQVVRDVAAGATGPVADIVALNAAAGLLAYAGPRHQQGLAEQLAPQLDRVRQSMADGSMASLLDRWVSATRAA